MEVKQIFPLFEEGRILKRDSLDFIRDYAPDFFRLLFGEYGNADNQHSRSQSAA